jgi:hypothetical protein
MRELFVEDGVESASRPATSPDAAQEIRDAIAGRHVCPFCGAVREDNSGACPRCSMENTSASRQATKARVGPWYVFQSRNPAAPGMKFDTLLGFVRKGRVKARSIVRGPTTHQLWRFAAHVKGISREFGICYSCGGAIERTASLCPHCNRLQEPPDNPDAFLEGQELEAPARPAARRELGPTPLAAEDIVVPPLSQQRPTSPAAPSEDLLDASAPQDKTTALKKGSPDGFLSPQDLAAAFNLDFRPKGRHARQMQAQLQRQFQQEQRHLGMPRRRRHWGRIIFLLVLLLAVGAGAFALYTRPDLRDRATDYANQGVAWVKQKWSQWKPPPSSKAAQTKAEVSADTPVQPVAVGVASELQKAQPDQKQSDQKQPDQKQAAPSGKSSPWDQLYQSQQAPAKSAPSSESTSPPQPQGTIDDMRKLYWEAIDAEAQGNFDMAVKKYEQIKQMPHDLWPRDLDLRLDQARKQVH